jgi:hypothetical protein
VAWEARRSSQPSARVPARSAAPGASVSGARSGDTPDPQNFRFEPVQVLLVRGGHEDGVALVVRNCIKPSCFSAHAEFSLTEPASSADDGHRVG